jgi:hypothetical protein
MGRSVNDDSYNATLKVKRVARRLHAESLCVEFLIESIEYSGLILIVFVLLSDDVKDRFGMIKWKNCANQPDNF